METDQQGDQQGDQQESNLETPLPDQPIETPTEEQQDGGETQDESTADDSETEVSEEDASTPRRSWNRYKRTPLQAAGLDQKAAEEARQAELAEAREEHNLRTGDASLR